MELLPSLFLNFCSDSDADGFQFCHRSNGLLQGGGAARSFFSAVESRRPIGLVSSERRPRARRRFAKLDAGNHSRHRVAN